MHSSRRRLHRRDRQSKDLVGSKSELVVVVVVVAALVVKVPVVAVEVSEQFTPKVLVVRVGVRRRIQSSPPKVAGTANSLLTLSGTRHRSLSSRSTQVHFTRRVPQKHVVVVQDPFTETRGGGMCTSSAFLKFIGVTAWRLPRKKHALLN